MKRTHVLVSTGLALCFLTACSFPLLGMLLPSPTPPVLSPTPSVTTAPPSETPTPPASPTPSPTATTTVSPTPASDKFAVVLVAPNDVLNIHAAAGANQPIVGKFPPTATNVVRTGPIAQVGENAWVEVVNPSGGRGWVNAFYLTEYIPSVTFCVDKRVNKLLDKLESALKNRDGDLLASLVSPVHGMDVIHIRNGTVANYTPAEASWLFQSSYVVNWGPQAGSGQDLKGSFKEIVLPKLLEVFSNNSSSCDLPETGGATYDVSWPLKYTNINYYSIYNPGTTKYGGLDWQTWLIGVEYVKKKPYLFALLHFEWEP
jgi:hypothetical protein